MSPSQILALATSALSAVETLITYIVKLKAMAAAAGATDAELADVDVRLTEAIARREAE
jgi:hypothetical protein